MNYWIARDNNGSLCLYDAEPVWDDVLDEYEINALGQAFMEINEHIHPEFSSIKAGEKRPVKLIITLKE